MVAPAVSHDSVKVLIGNALFAPSSHCVVFLSYNHKVYQRAYVSPSGQTLLNYAIISWAREVFQKSFDMTLCSAFKLLRCVKCFNVNALSTCMNRSYFFHQLTLQAHVPCSWLKGPEYWILSCVCSLCSTSKAITRTSSHSERIIAPSAKTRSTTLDCQ